MRIAAVAMFLVLVPAVAASAARSPATEPAPTRYRLWLQVVPPDPLPAAVRDAAVREAAAIWAPYGVDVAWSHQAPPDHAWDILVRVVVEDGELGADGTAIATIDFIDGVIPRDVVRLSVPRARALMRGARLHGRPLVHHPPRGQQQFMGRALGRALAHEIGHYLIGSPLHTPDGLMRPDYSSADLAEHDRGKFRLSAEEARRMHANLASQMAQCALVMARR